MNALTLEVILQVVFGVTDESRLAELRPLVNRTVNIPPLVFLGWGIPRLQRFGPWRRTVENQVALDRVIFAEIADRRRATDLADRPTCSRACCRSATRTGRGSPTRSCATSWSPCCSPGTRPRRPRSPGPCTSSAATRRPRRRARAAAVSGDTDHLEAVLKESMRLHPVIPMVVRHLMAPATVGGIDLPRGTNVAASILLAHESEASHPDHTRFRPERFLEGEVATNTWIPFGGGVRRCIGAGFSLMEGVAVLREVLTAYDVTLPAGEKETPLVRNITSVPRNGARVVVARR